ncbi:hypothetical protein ACFLXD_03570, partial [Chloroflexota bacterium]
MKNERGQALPLTLIILTIGTLVITPFLGHASSAVIGSGVYGQTITALSAGDAGVEHAIWRLTNDGLAAQLPSPGDNANYQLSETVNGVTPSITVNVEEIFGNGQILDTVVDTLEFDIVNGVEPSIIDVSGNIFAIAYSGPGSDGFLMTMEVNSGGQTTTTVIDNLEFDATNGGEPELLRVSGDVYA